MEENNNISVDNFSQYFIDNLYKKYDFQNNNNNNNQNIYQFNNNIINIFSTNENFFKFYNLNNTLYNLLTEVYMKFDINNIPSKNYKLEIIEKINENIYTKENLINRIKNYYIDEKVFNDFFKQKNLFVENDVDLLNCIIRFIEQKIISFLVKLFFILESTNYINSYVNIKDKNIEIFQKIDDLYNKNKELKLENKIITINKPYKYNFNKSIDFFKLLITEIQLNLDKLDNNEKLVFEIIKYKKKENEEREIEEFYIENWKNFLDEINSNFFKEYENDIQFKEIFDCNENNESFNLLLEDLIKFLNLKIKIKKEFSIGVMKTIVEKLVKNLELFKIINLSNFYKIIYVISYVFYNENFIKNI